MGHDEDKKYFNARVGMRPGRDITAAQAELDRISATSNPNKVEETGDIVLSAPVVKTKKNPKVIILGVLLVLAIIAVVVSIILTKGNLFKNNPEDVIGSSNLSIIFDEKAYLPFEDQSSGLFGYYDPLKNEKVISAKYSRADRFYGEYASVSYEKSGALISAIIDKQGNVKVEQNEDFEENPRYDVERNLWYINHSVYDNTLKKITPDGVRSTYIGNGYFYNVSVTEEATPAATEKTSEDQIIKPNTPATGATDGSAAAAEPSRKLGNAYITDKDQNKKYECGGNCAVYTVKAGNDVYLVAKEWGKSAKIVNANTGEEIYSAAKASAIEYVDDGVLREGKSYIVIKDGAISTTEKYVPEKTADSVSNAGEYSVTTCDGGNIRIVDASNNEITGCDYTNAIELSNSAYRYMFEKKKIKPIILEKIDKVVLYDLANKKEVIELPSGEYSTYENNLLVLVEANDGKEKICSVILTENPCKELDNMTVDFFDNYAVAEKIKGGAVYYNMNLKEFGA